jgi:hypothetical protein
MSDLGFEKSKQQGRLGTGSVDSKVFSIARIHNNETLQESLESQALMTLLLERNSLTHKTFEVSYQPTLLPLNQFPKPRKSLIVRRNRQRHLELGWALYLGRKVGFYGKIKSFASQILYSWKICTKKNQLSEEVRALQIEQFVSMKHLSAFRRATSGVLIILESDAAIHENSSSQLNEIIKILLKNIKNEMYFNIAGGLGKTEIGIQRLAKEMSESVDYYDKPVSNTSCAYAVTESFVQRFVAFIDANVEVLDFSIDWIFNSYFMHQESQILCLHSNPPGLLHGSFAGKSESWNPKNRI